MKDRRYRNPNKLYIQAAAVALIIVAGVLLQRKWIDPLSGAALLATATGLLGATRKELAPHGQGLPRNDDAVTTVERINQ